jgi:exosortase/archaeosortase family protein
VRAAFSPLRLLTPAQRSVSFRLAIVFLFTMAVRYAATSVWLIQWSGKLTLEPQGYFGMPEILLGSCLIGLVMIARDRFDRTDIAWPQWRQILASSLCLILAVVFVFDYTHPDHAALIDQMTLANQSPAFYGPLLTGVYYMVLFLPFLPACATVFSWRFLRDVRWGLLGPYIVAIAYVFSSFAAVKYHDLAVRPIMFFSRGVLNLFSPDVQANPQTLEMAYKSFAVAIGPACGGLRFSTVFTVLFGTIWYSLARQRDCRHGRAVLAYIGGLALLFVLNVLRIVAIMLVGSRWPDVGVMLFHGSIGFILFLFVFALYLRFVVPWLRRGI